MAMTPVAERRGPRTGLRLRGVRQFMRTHVGDVRIRLLQLLLLLVFLCGWEFVPRIPGVQQSSHFLDPYFVSSPDKILAKSIALADGNGVAITIWPFIWRTVAATLVGTAVGMALGAAIGLALGSSTFWDSVLRPYVVAANAIPRIAIIPLIVVIVGPVFLSSVAISVTVVFFVAFFNAYEGARSVPRDQIRSSTLLGAQPHQIMLRVRLPYALAWTFASFPLGITFALLSVITGEVLMGYPGLGRLIEDATVSADSTLTFATVVYVAIVSVVLVAIAEAAKRRVLHWWISR